MSSNEDEAIELAQTAVDQFPKFYAAAYVNRMRDKFGLYISNDANDESDVTLMDEFLELLQADSVDFTLSFRALSQNDPEPLIELFNDKTSIKDWHARWYKRVEPSYDTHRMQQSNPAVIPRNHWIEATIQSALQGNWDLFQEFEKALKTPYHEHATFSTPPDVEQRIQATFCGT